MRKERLKLVLDTGILMLILKGDPKVSNVVKEIAQGAKAYTTTANLIEIYYKTEEKLGKETAITWFNRIAYSKDLTISPINLKLSLRAGEIKAKYKKLISIVDAVIIALAEKENATLITTDKRLKEVEEVKVKIYETLN